MMRRVGTILATLALCAVIAMPSYAFAADTQVAIQKDETVYVYTDATGSVKSIEISTLLKNEAGAAELKDTSNLADIKAKDDVEFKRSGDSVIWAADGKNVTYNGITNVAAPVTLKATYTLDGVKVAPEELAGKSGHVTIRYEFTNHSVFKTSDGGSAQTVYVPFTCITAIMLDGKDFKNVAVENCKVINDGDDMIVAGYAFPGLKESLGSIADGADIPESFSITADVTGFELKSSMTVVTAGLFDGIDSSDFDAGEYADASDGLREAMDELTNGSSKLTDGLKSLSDGAKSLSDGAMQLDEKVSSGTRTVPDLIDGIVRLHSGASNLANGVSDLRQGLVDAKGSIDEVQRGADALADRLSGDNIDKLVSVLAAAAEQIGNDNGIIEELKTSANAANESIAEANAAFDDIDYSKIPGEELEKIERAKSALNNVSGHVGELNGIAKTLESDELSTATGTLMSSKEQLENASTAARSLADGLQEMSDNLGDEDQPKTLIGAAAKLQSGAEQLVQGLATLEDKSSELEAGMSQLEAGASKIAQGASGLSEATQQAAVGSEKMTEGLRQFNDQGISKIMEAIDDKIVGLSNRISEIIDAGSEYTNFGGITPGTEGTVKFIIEVDAIAKE